MQCDGLSLWFLVLGAAALPTTGRPQPIHVRVVADEAAGVDAKALRDSAGDLSRVLESRSGFRSVDRPELADLEVRILRRFRQRTERVAMLPIGTTFLFLPVEERVVQASLVAGDTRLELLGRHPKSWRAAARTLADALEEWAREHKELLQGPGRR